VNVDGLMVWPATPGSQMVLTRPQDKAQWWLAEPGTRRPPYIRRAYPGREIGRFPPLWPPGWVLLTTLGTDTTATLHAEADDPVFGEPADGERVQERVRLVLHFSKAIPGLAASQSNEGHRVMFGVDAADRSARIIFWSAVAQRSDQPGMRFGLEVGAGQPGSFLLETIAAI
jgi:hypothetical protein